MKKQISKTIEPQTGKFKNLLGYACLVVGQKPAKLNPERNRKKKKKTTVLGY